MAKRIINIKIVEIGQEYDLPEGAEILKVEEIPCAIRYEKAQIKITYSEPVWIW